MFRQVSPLISKMNKVAIKLFFFFSILCFSAQAQFKYYEKGHDRYTGGDYDAAIENFSQYLTKPTRDKALDIEVFYLRALSFYKKGKHKEAIADFEEAILLDHSNKGNIYWFKAKSYDKLGLYNESVADYTKAIRALGSDKQVKAKLLYERSQEYMKLGNIILAYEDLENGSLAQPGNTDIKKELEKLAKQETVIASRSAKENQKRTDETTKAAVAKKDEPVVKKEVVNNTDTKSNAINETPINSLSKNQQQRVEEVKQPVTTAPTLADAYKDEKRYALVIGNSNYPKEIGVLKNPVNDATDIAKELRNSNFEVDLLTNATYGQMRAAMLKFKERVDAGDRDKTVSLFYYAGHGLAHDDENYLVPIDASIEYEDDIARYCFAVQRMVLANMERSNSRMNIVILDACRNNPFPALTRSAGQQGLGEMRRARGSFIAYATAPGSVASDGSGRNGLYTQELLKAMRKPGLAIEQVFKEVRQGVLRMSGDKQNTWDSSNIVGEFYFKF
jgi:tetratricopeptide (TPR) repeat protein